jgi:hypothetical protein
MIPAPVPSIALRTVCMGEVPEDYPHPACTGSSALRDEFCEDAAGSALTSRYIHHGMTGCQFFTRIPVR